MPNEGESLLLQSIQERVQRLEAVIAIQFVYSADASIVDERDFRHLLEVLLHHGPPFWPRFVEEILHLGRRRPTRLDRLESAVDELRQLREDVSHLQQTQERAAPLLQNVAALVDVAPAIPRLDHRTEDIAARTEELSRSLKNQIAALRSTRDFLHATLWSRSIGIDPANTPEPAYLPVRLFVAGHLPPKAARAVDAAIVDFLRSLGLDPEDDLPEEPGSRVKRWWAKAKDLFARKKVAEHLEDHLVNRLDQARANRDKTDAETTKNLAEAAKATAEARRAESEANLMDAQAAKAQAEARNIDADTICKIANAADVLHKQLKGLPADAVLQIGPFVATRVNGALNAKILDDRQLQQFETNRDILRDPPGVRGLLDPHRGKNDTE